jgi:SAM-dependent methyltransferase
MPPSPFVIQWAPYVAARARPRPSALDVATGSGRHLSVLAAAGFRPFGVDLSLEALRDARRQGAAPGPVWCADLTRTLLPANRFDLVLVTRYLERSLFPALKGAVVPGGFIVYETFTCRQLQHGTGPRSPAYLLELGELRHRFVHARGGMDMSGGVDSRIEANVDSSLGPPRFDVVFYEECDTPEAVARLVARRVG